MLYDAYNHIVHPTFYAGFTPSFIPLNIANILATIVEFIVGILLLIPKTRKIGGLSFSLLMIIFLPIHIWDYTKDILAIGSKDAAVIRLIVQGIFIAIGFWIYKDNNKNYKG